MRSKGARLIGTNSDLTGPTEQGIVPACRALVAPIELATGKEAYYIGKPNPLMMRTGINLLGGTPRNTVIIGDRMDTDIVAGIECGLDTVLVPSGVTDRSMIDHFPYRPRLVLQGWGTSRTRRRRGSCIWSPQWAKGLPAPGRSIPGGRKQKTLKPLGFRVFLVDDTGLEPVTSPHVKRMLIPAELIVRLLRNEYYFIGFREICQ